MTDLSDVNLFHPNQVQVVVIHWQDFPQEKMCFLSFSGWNELAYSFQLQEMFLFLLLGRYSEKKCNKIALKKFYLIDSLIVFG